MTATNAKTGHSVFEAMFDRVLRPTGDFAAALLRLGYDPARPELSYPTETWLKALDLAHQFVYPQLSSGEADRELGRRFFEGFLETITGKFVKLALPLVGAEGMLRRLPRYCSSTQADIQVDLVDEGPKQVRVHFASRYSRPEFMAGLLEAVPGFQYRVTVLRHDPTGSELRVTW
jgi:uncharacterized protein (TIGR02265 family)